MDLKTTELQNPKESQIFGKTNLRLFLPQKTDSLSDELKQSVEYNFNCIDIYGRK